MPGVLAAHPAGRRTLDAKERSTVPRRTLTPRTWRRAVLVSAAVAVVLVGVLVAASGDLDPSAPLGGTVEWLTALVRYRDQPWTTFTLVVEELGVGVVCGVTAAAVASGALVLVHAWRRRIASPS